MVEAPGASGESEASEAIDEADGTGGRLSETSVESEWGSALNVSVFA